MIFFNVRAAIASVALGNPQYNGCDNMGQFCSVVAARLGGATHGVEIVLVAAFAIDVDDGYVALLDV